MRITWNAQNEETDDDGFYLDGRAFEEAERKELEGMGAPDTDKLVFVKYEVTDRDSAEITADATDAFVAWVRENEMEA